MAASVWIRLFSCSELVWVLLPATIWRPSPETMPVVTVFSNSPSGLPMAIASCPSFRAPLSPSGMVGRPVASTLTMARSVRVSMPYTVPVSWVVSLRTTVSWVAPSTTWRLVRIQPFESKMKPEPMPLCPPNTPWLVEAILTTAGIALEAAVMTADDSSTVTLLTLVPVR